MQPRARRITCRDAIAEIERVLGPSPQIDVGSLRDLDRDGSCWEVYTPRTAFDGTTAYFEPARGDLLALWHVLEG